MYIWTSNRSLLDVIRQAWEQDVDGSPLRILCSNLLATRRAIQEWNKNSFGNVFEAVRAAEENVLRVESRVEHDSSKEAQIELSKVQAELRHALWIDEQFWSQKTRVKWLQVGDSNSKFFMPGSSSGGSKGRFIV